MQTGGEHNTCNFGSEYYPVQQCQKAVCHFTLADLYARFLQNFKLQPNFGRRNKTLM
jgi:hypothetical protein